MGVKDLWQVIEPSKRSYSLEEICSHHRLQNNGRPLRMAIDVALWSFQAQSSVGGARPELRLMFLRFCRLYELGIRPIFVFDGPRRPSFKRNRVIRTLPIETEFSSALRELIRIFDFYSWNAQGEAEAECAMLERLGFVDVIMTGDVDVFLFGGRRLMRHWVQRRFDQGEFYDMAWINHATDLDRSDLILMALLRGNDYDHGSERVGIRVAEALARRKSHISLMETIQKNKSNNQNDDDQDNECELADQLRHDLEYHLRTGCHGELQRYTDMDLSQFPDQTILHAFIHPLTYIETHAARDLTSWLARVPMPDLPDIALFCKEAFEWSSDYVVKRFKNLLFLGYVYHRLRTQACTTPSDALPQLRTPSSQGTMRQRDSQSQDIRSFFTVTTKSGTTVTTTASPASSSQSKMDHVEKNTITSISNDDRSDDKEDIVGIRLYKKEKSLELFNVEIGTHVMDKFVSLVKSRLDEKDVFSFSHDFLASSQLQSQDTKDTGKAEEDFPFLDAQGEEDEGENSGEKKTQIRLCRWMPIDVVQMAYPRMVQAYLDSRKNIAIEKTSNRSASSTKRNRRPTSTPKGHRNKKPLIDNTQRLLTEFINHNTSSQDPIIID